MFYVFQTMLFDPHQTCGVEAPGGRATVSHHCGQDAGQSGSRSCKIQDSMCLPAGDHFNISKHCWLINFCDDQTRY